MRTIVFSSNDFPEHFDDDARFRRWHEMFEAQLSCFAPLRDHPFFAHLHAAVFDGLRITRFDGTIGRFGRTAAAVMRGPDDDFRITVNLADAAVHVSQRGREARMSRGAGVLLGFGESNEILADQRSCWIGLTVSRDRLRRLVANADDLVARTLEPAHPAVRLLGRYLESALPLGNAGESPELEKHMGATLVDLAVLALGAQGEAAEVARMRGLRAARLREVLTAIKARFTDPAISSEEIAHGLGLSQRYVNKLLFETGRTFAEHVLELRLQKARAMLESPQHDTLKISDIALACGFNEVSYFNRRFRARFGMSPTACRGS